MGEGWGRSEGERHSGGAETGTESLGVGERLGTIRRRAPQWRGWNRYRVPGVGGRFGTIRRRAPQWRGSNRYRIPGGGGQVLDDRKENVTVKGLEQV